MENTVTSSWRVCVSNTCGLVAAVDLDPHTRVPSAPYTHEQQQQNEKKNDAMPSCTTIAIRAIAATVERANVAVLGHGRAVSTAEPEHAATVAASVF